MRVKIPTTWLVRIVAREHSWLQCQISLINMCPLRLNWFWSFKHLKIAIYGSRLSSQCWKEVNKVKREWATSALQRITSRQRQSPRELLRFLSLIPHPGCWRPICWSRWVQRKRLYRGYARGRGGRVQAYAAAIEVPCTLMSIMHDQYLHYSILWPTSDISAFIRAISWRGLATIMWILNIMILRKVEPVVISVTFLVTITSVGTSIVTA